MIFVLIQIATDYANSKNALASLTSSSPKIEYKHGPIVIAMPIIEPNHTVLTKEKNPYAF